MRRFLKSLHLTRISFGLAAVLPLCAASSLVQAQAPPLVYTVENTGASLPLTGTIPTMASAPIMRQLPDPFVFLDGVRDTTWVSEEQHRQEWMHAAARRGGGDGERCDGEIEELDLGHGDGLTQEEEGQGLCPWTPLGTSPQTPFYNRGLGPTAPAGPGHSPGAPFASVE